MKLKRIMVLLIGALFVLLPCMVEAKGFEPFATFDIYRHDELILSFDEAKDPKIEEHIGENVCQDDNVINALRVVGYFIFIAKIIIPFIIIGFGIFDLAKAVTGGDSDKVAKGVKTIGVRVLIGILVFALPSIVNIILDIGTNLNDEETGYGMCQTCLLDPWACEHGAPDEEYNPHDIFDDDPVTRPSCKTINGVLVCPETTTNSTEFVEKQTSGTHNTGDKGSSTTKKVIVQVEE